MLYKSALASTCQVLMLNGHKAFRKTEHNVGSLTVI